jgi:hypothetical protein
MMYALVDPKGKIIEDTAGYSKSEAQGCAFNYMAKKLGPQWEREHWKKWNAGQRSIRALGYSIRKVKLVLA